MFNFRKLIGIQGEAAAVRFLKKNGCRIVETNYRNKIGEVDIIAKDKDVLVFVEVKTRKNNDRISPKEAVTLSKQRKISQVALMWLKTTDNFDKKARFDVIAIGYDEKTHIEWVKNAFELNAG